MHKAPAIIKLIALLLLSIFCVSLPSIWLGAGIFTAILIAFICGFTLREQLTDFKPAVFYAALMYSLSVFSNLYENRALLNIQYAFASVFIPRPDFMHIALRLILIVQLSALLFRTTSPLEIRRVIRIEAISLFLCFIPEIFQTWSAINLSWKARGGKQGLVKIKTLVFLLISLSMEKAAVKAKALQARKN